MDSKPLFIGAGILVFMVVCTWQAETFAAARPYATGSIMLMCMALATLKVK
jgi:hypothetical protein